MAQYFTIHPDNPQPRLIGQAAAALRHGGVIVYPTDSCYALGCLMGNKAGMDRIARIRRLEPKHELTLMCRDLSDVGLVSRLDNSTFRLIKAATPGPYTFILRARRGLPRRILHPRRKTVGVRIPDNRICLALLESLGEPLLSSSLILPQQDFPETEPLSIFKALGGQVELVIDGGAGSAESTSVINLAAGAPEVVRRGRGDVGWLQT